MKAEWWKAGPVDNFNLKTKLNRVGCRPLRRKFLSCKATDDSIEHFADCKVRESWLTWFRKSKRKLMNATKHCTTCRCRRRKKA
ncbi:MAG: hypothetical protein ACK521_04315 [bacterium]